MLRLATILYSLIATAIAGSAVIAVLAAGMVTGIAIISAAVAGAIIAAPVTWLVAKRLYNGG